MPRATSSRSTMSSTNGMPRATTPRSTPRARKVLVTRHEVKRPGSPGRFCLRRKPLDKVDLGAALRSSAPGRNHAMKNLLTDISGVRVGHADDKTVASGATAVIFDHPAVAAIDVRGGGPGIREGALLDLANTVERIDALVLAGGSAFGLEAGGGVQAWLAEQGRGFAVGDAVIPIVPGAIMFDLLNGGDKAWGRFAPYRELGYAAAAAAGTDFALGSFGAGLGATTANFKGGIGSASAATPVRRPVPALAVVHGVRHVTNGRCAAVWARPVLNPAPNFPPPNSPALSPDLP